VRQDGIGRDAAFDECLQLPSLYVDEPHVALMASSLLFSWIYSKCEQIVNASRKHIKYEAVDRWAWNQQSRGWLK
jgi:hypothetical protein